MPTEQEIFEDLRDQLVAYAVTNNITSEQSFDATRVQLGNILGIAPDDPIWSGGNSGRFENLRYQAAVKLRDQEDQSILSGFLIKIDDYLTSRFPNVEFEKRRVRGLRILIIHFDGKLEEIV